MKFLKTTLILSLCAVLFSCTNEDENPSNKVSILGNWQLTSMKYDGVASYSTDGTDTEHSFSGEASEIDFILDFSDSPKRFTSAGGYLITLTYDFMGQEMQMPALIEDFMGEGIWELDGDVLIITSTGQPTDEMKILKLTADELILEGDASRSGTESNALLDTSISGVFTFKR